MSHCLPRRLLLLGLAIALLAVGQGTHADAGNWEQPEIGPPDASTPVKPGPKSKVDPASRKGPKPVPPVSQKTKLAKAKPKAPDHPQKRAAIRTNRITDRIDPIRTGATTPRPDGTTPPSGIVPPLPQPLPSLLQPRLVAPAHVPGNPIFTVDPATDTAEKANDPDEVLGPANTDQTYDPAASRRNATTFSPTSSSTNGLTAPASPNGTTPSGAATTGTDTQFDANGRPIPTVRNALRPRPLTPLDAPKTALPPLGPTGVTSSIAQAPLPATTPNPRSSLEDPLTDSQATAYDQVGMRIGSFIWRPAIEASVGATSNIQSVTGGTQSSALRIAPELSVQSDWSRHAFGVELRGSFTEFPAAPSLYRPTGTATVTGRIDFADDTRLALKASYGVDKLPSTSALSAAGTTGAGYNDTITGSAALTRDIGRFALTLRGEIDRSTSQLNAANTTTTSSTGLNNTDYIASLRGSYRLSEGLRPFIEVSTDVRRYDTLSQDTTTSVPTSHDSTGGAIKGGAMLDFGPILTGEGSVGYGVSVPTNGSLKDLKAFTVDDSIVWSPTRMTRVTFSTVTALEPSLITGASGAVSRTVGVKFANDLFRNLTIDLGGSYLARSYTGVSRTENLGSLTSGLTWKINPTMQTFVRATFDDFTSSAHTDDYKTATIYAGVRLQK